MIYLQLFWIFFKIGLFTIGGGYAMIPMMEEEIIAQGWMSETELVNFIAISESTPGPFAINVATFVGATVPENALLGAAVSTLGMVLPSFIIILIIAKLFANYSKNKNVKIVLGGIHPVIVALILSVAMVLLYNNTSISTTTFDLNWPYFLILGIVVLLKVFVKKISPIFLIIISAGLGMIIYSII